MYLLHYTSLYLACTFLLIISKYYIPIYNIIIYNNTSLKWRINKDYVMNNYAILYDSGNRHVISDLHVKILRGLLGNYQRYF